MEEINLFAIKDARGTIPQTAHLVGVCGAGMKALAELLQGQGWQLSGSDMLPAVPGIAAMTHRGFQFHQGHAAGNLRASTELLVYSPAVPPANPERAEATARGIPQRSYSQMIGWLMQSQIGVCIAGTHGKSTTTAMVGWILSVARRDPAVLVGAELCDGGQSGRTGNSGLLVVESCEFQRSFLDFQPHHAAILNIETDHFDCYADLPSVVTAFREFAARLPSDGVLLVNGDSTACLDAVVEASARIVTFGSSSKCDWQSGEFTDSTAGTTFTIRNCGENWGTARLRLHGHHNRENALAAAALCAEIGIDRTDILSALGSFGGVKRRFEVVGEWKGMLLIDDYAHHPTAVRATLATARQVFGQRHIRCVFQPHQVSRTLGLMDEFETCFDDADELLVLPAFAARERVTTEPRQVSEELVRRIASRGRSARFVESLDQTLITVDDAARPGDILIAMGAGDIDRINHELTRRLRRDH
jgi:UDP-N-acetylmuramate--alanine ligase